MRNEEEQFLELLDAVSAEDLLSEIKMVDKQSLDRRFYRIVSQMVNSYGFSKKEVLDAVLSDKNRTSVFKILALHWVKAQAERYRTDYFDDRDRDSVAVCKKVTQLLQWEKLYKKTVKLKMSQNRKLSEHGRCIKQEETYGMWLIDTLRDMHPTNRQTFSGFVLSFLMQCEGYEKFQREVFECNILFDKNVKFLMI